RVLVGGRGDELALQQEAVSHLAQEGANDGKNNDQPEQSHASSVRPCRSSPPAPPPRPEAGQPPPGPRPRTRGPTGRGPRSSPGPRGCPNRPLAEGRGRAPRSPAPPSRSGGR